MGSSQRKQMSKMKNMIVLKLGMVVLSIFCFLCVQAKNAHADVYMTISGNVQDASTGKGIPNVNVVAIPKTAGQNFHATTDSNGNYVLDSVTKGQYDVYISPPPPGYVYKPYKQEIMVSPGQNIVNLNFMLPPAGAISGIAYLGDGVTPLSNAQIFGLSDTGVAVGTTDQFGNYILDGFPPENAASVRILTYGYGMAVINGLSINARQTTPNIKITLPNASSGIQGIVGTADAISLPISNAFVLLAGNNGAGVTMTDANGNYKITGLPSGLYEADVYSINYAPKTIQVLISQNQFTTNNFMLDPQSIPLNTVSAENDQTNIKALEVPFDKVHTLYLYLADSTAISCHWCTEVGFSVVPIFGVSFGKIGCRCTECLNGAEVTKYEVWNIGCACMGLGAGAGWNILQYCKNPPQDGTIAEGWELDLPIKGTPFGVSFSGECKGAGVGPAVGLYYCSCSVTQAP